MAEEIYLLQQLVQLATKKKEALYDNDLEALRQVVEKEEEALAVVERFQQLDERQIHYCGDATQYTQDRVALLTQLKEINLLNQQLLEDALAIVDYSLKLIHGEEESQLYGSSGKVEAAAGNQPVLNWRG
jgi:flagellar biosynthesis/type III secretory pathway chaperone